MLIEIHTNYKLLKLWVRDKNTDFRRVFKLYNSIVLSWLPILQYFLRMYYFLVYSEQCVKVLYRINEYYIMETLIDFVILYKKNLIKWLFRKKKKKLRRSKQNCKFNNTNILLKLSHWSENMIILLIGMQIQITMFLKTPISCSSN